eukprot:3538717-Rhodomonas_salina.1
MAASGMHRCALSGRWAQPAREIAAKIGSAIPIPHVVSASFEVVSAAGEAEGSALPVKHWRQP